MSGLEHHDSFEPYYAENEPSTATPAESRAAKMRERAKRLAATYRDQHHAQSNQRSARAGEVKLPQPE